MTAADILREAGLFRALGPAESASVDRFAAVRQLEEGEEVFRANTPATHVFVLRSGRVHLRLPIDADGGTSPFSLIVAKVEPGALLGGAALVGPERYTTTAFCAKPCEVLAIAVRPLRELLKLNPQLGSEVMGIVARSYCDRYVQLLRHLQHVINQLPIVT